MKTTTRSKKHITKHTKHPMTSIKHAVDGKIIAPPLPLIFLSVWMILGGNLEDILDEILSTFEGHVQENMRTT